jgi:hypothetical protein
MAMQRPGRSPTRLGQPAVKAPAKAAPAAKPAPAARPPTGPVPRQGAPARTGRSTTRSVPTSGGARPTARTAPAKSNTALFIGIGVGAVLLLVGAYAALGGKSGNNAPTSVDKPSKPKPVDVSGLERDGMAKCNEGLALIQKNQSQLASHDLSAGQKQSLIADLEKGKKLIADGMGLLTQANEKSKNTYDTKQYQEALITVRKKLMELRE